MTPLTQHRRADSLATGPLPATRIRFIRKKLLDWYDRHARDLPWRRRAGDPYAQLVAEFMLQQTRVDTVIAYYGRFLARFPDVSTLARADDEHVLKHWEGLGYYRRALNLHRAAKLLVREDKPIPKTPVELRELPGIGVYTAAAIASIAFGVCAAAVDGNVARILARLFGIADDVSAGAGKKRAASLAEQLVPARRPGDFNQAWMDLGSMICTPRSPDCPRCPLEAQCHAAGTGLTDVLPIRASAKSVQTVHAVVGVFVHRRRMLVHRRVGQRLWPGLWEFPNTTRATLSARSKALHRLAGELGVEPTRRLRVCAEIEHRLTHRLYRFCVFVTPVERTTPTRRGRAWRWVSQRQFQAMSVSTAHRRILAAAQGEIDRLLGRRIYSGSAG